MKKNDGFEPYYVNKMRTSDLHRANIAFIIDGRGRMDIIKNRYKEPKENLSLEESIELFSTILAQARYKGITKVFEEGMKNDLKESMQNVINKHKGGEVFDTFS